MQTLRPDKSCIKKEHIKAFLGLLHCHKSELLFNESVRQYNKLKKGKKNVSK
jgi:hypothetical protein